MALGERAVRRRTPALEQSGKAEQKTQDDGAENVSAGERLPAHLQPCTNLASGRLPGDEHGSVVELTVLSRFAELRKEFLPIYVIFFLIRSWGLDPAGCSLEPGCPGQHPCGAARVPARPGGRAAGRPAHGIAAWSRALK